LSDVEGALNESPKRERRSGVKAILVGNLHGLLVLAQKGDLQLVERTGVTGEPVSARLVKPGGIEHGDHFTEERAISLCYEQIGFT
jgi:hypothetical protein